MPESHARYMPGFNYGARLMVLAVVFICGAVVTGIIGGIIDAGQSSSRVLLLWSVVLQNLFTFAIPALLSAWILTRRPLVFTGLAQGFSFRACIGMIVLFAVGLPFINQLVAWNEAVRLPAAMSAVEEELQAMEAAARAMSEKLLDAEETSSMLVGLLVIGCLTGLCEELFFRGALQRLLQGRSVGPHAAVWISAVVFSVMHFQFYGFIPRIFLGAFFGYLLLWSGSLWLSAMAHALNNGLVVAGSWMEARGLAENLDSFGVASGNFPWVAVISFIAVVVMLIVGKNWMFENPKKLLRHG